jgi:D-lactate dehydrogenase (cytochrome)
MPRTKNAAGIFSAPNMDLIDLFIGSEGIFGAVTQVEVALQSWRSPVSIVLFLPSDDKAIENEDSRTPQARHRLRGPG